MELALQMISNEKTVGSDAVQVLREFNSQYLSNQAKNGKQPIGMMPAIKRAFDLMGDDIVELSTAIDALKNKNRFLQ